MIDAHRPAAPRKHRALVVALCWIAGLLIAPFALYGVLFLITQPPPPADLTTTNVIGTWKSVEDSGSITINDDGTFTMTHISVNPVEDREDDFTASGTWRVFQKGKITFIFGPPAETVLDFQSEQDNGVVSLWYRIVDTEHKYKFQRIGD